MLDRVLWGIRIRIEKVLATKCYLPSSEELEEGLGAVHYEMKQLLDMAFLTNSDEALRNAIVESRLISARTLLHFFENGPRQDDIICAHFEFPRTKLPVDQVYRDRLNKDLAHLTYARTKKRTAADREWPPQALVSPLLDRCYKFARHVLRTFEFKNEQQTENWQVLLQQLTRATTDSSVISCMSAAVLSTTTNQVEVHWLDKNDPKRRL